MRKLESKQKHYDLESVFKSETRRKVLNSYVRLKVNNHKGALRRLVLASLKNSTRKDLAQTALKIQQSLGISFTNNDNSRFMARVALLRQYTQDNVIGKDEGDDQKKQDSFFVGFDTWLGAKVAVWGNNFDSEDWRNYLTQTLAAENNANNTTIATPPDVQDLPTSQLPSDRVGLVSGPDRPIAPLPTRRIPSSLQHSIPVPTQSRFPDPAPCYPPSSPRLASSSGHRRSVSASIEGTGGLAPFRFDSSPIMQSHHLRSNSSTPHHNNGNSRFPSTNLLGMQVPPSSSPASNFESTGRTSAFRPWE
ncbi:hypothetical protein DFJ43DRAFT_493113 [Lentinula guzmanii]|uniref:Uncharacterized protein n=1 Tax=Lentinula guzmanii TaxID=2804957 RepID=A0AA38MRR3_9AGAR|nr:hypothetical protein DFJ43DRAFT_718122 [Lentinula guzmanii]KAJ3729005.1 hypothetical protein DFJ43DRAFT_493113 [Lentinula guzmanii]